jgi:hypothetical protein
MLMRSCWMFSSAQTPGAQRHQIFSLTSVPESTSPPQTTLAIRAGNESRADERHTSCP